MAKKELYLWNPFKELENLRNEIDRFFDTDYESDSKLIFPTTDISEDDKNVYINIDLPGLTKDNVELEINDGYLKVKGKKEEKKEEKDKKRHYYRKERFYGEFERTIALPEYVKMEKAEASFKDGVLEIIIPKKEEKQPKKLEIKIK